MKNPLLVGVGITAVGLIFGLETLIQLTPHHPECIASVAPLPPSSPTPMVTQTPKIIPHNIGDIVSTGDRSIQVTSFYQTDHIAPHNPFAPPITAQIVVVPFIVTNTSNRTGNIFFTQFDLADGQGRLYSEIDDLSYSLWRSDAKIKPRSEGLYPGEHRIDVAAFIVAPDANTFKLHWKDQIINLTDKQHLPQPHSSQLTPSPTVTSISLLSLLVITELQVLHIMPSLMLFN